MVRLLAYLLGLACLLLSKAAVAGAEKQPRYLGSQVCAACHGDQAEAWANSHHAWALRPASPEFVLGDFEDAVFEHIGVRTRFFRRDEGYFVETEGPNGELAEFEIAYAVGVEPLQQYLVELDRGRLQPLDIAWDTTAKRWFHLFPGVAIAPDDGLHWTGSYKNWNGRCADCHSTGFVKAYEARSRRYQSRWSEMNVACEACHGPGEAHAAWARNPEAFAQTRFAGIDEVGFTISFHRNSPKTETELCAGCHSRRQSLGPDSRVPGSTLSDDFRLALLRQGLYHADGQILDEVYVHGSFLQSKMHAKGVRCSDCHEPHDLSTRAEGNDLCVACHNPIGNPRFPSLKKALFDGLEHHFHELGSPGALCVSCHMPARTYMVVDPRRDHSFRVPRPDLSVTLGTPNACTACHDDRDDLWAAGQVRAWYPGGRSGTPHFASTLAAARNGSHDAGLRLSALAADRTQSAIVRATALDLLLGYDPLNASGLADLLTDEAPLVRRAAVRLQGLAPPRLRVIRLLPRLKDPVRLVRIEAARLLLGVPPAAIPTDFRPTFAAAVFEYQASLLATADFPETQANLGGLAYRIGNTQAAEEAFRTALEMDPYFAQVWVQLGELLHAGGRSREALSTLREGVSKVPDEGLLHNALGLLLAEQGALADSAESLKRAAEHMPGNARVRYNLSLALERLGEIEAAGAAMHEALERAPDDPDIIYALGVHLLKTGDLDKAEAQASRLLELFPARSEGKQLLDEIRRQR